MDFGLPHLVAIGGYLRAHLDVRVEILDLNYEGGDHEKLLSTIESLGPVQMIGLSCFSSFDYLRVMTLAAFLRRHFPGVPLVSGGYHASALPNDVVFDGSPFDAVVVGEGERPMKAMVETVLGGGRIEQQIWGPDNVEDLDTLPPYDWSLLDRYWPRAHSIGKKLQVFLSRGCPYHCTFCMERAKTEYKWRAYSSERALDELSRLASYTDLSRWVVNIADPLFGFRRRWRREVLEGIIERKLFPRQYWTLTRSDDLEDEDVSLLARARFSIGIGAETGSPWMVTEMQKAKDPERYLDALARLAELSKRHRLNWAANVIVGHPGETERTMRETRSFLDRLFAAGGETCGWLSFDPFRLYPGALVHEQMAQYGERFGTRFHHPQWWKSWYDGPFRAEHIDPSAELSFERRVTLMHELYGPLLTRVQAGFKGQGRSVDRVFSRSIAEQADLLSPQRRDVLLARAAKASSAPIEPSNGEHPKILSHPIGLQVRDPAIRQRENAVRRLLERGVLRTDALIEALCAVSPQDFLPEGDATAMLGGHAITLGAEGTPSRWLPLSVYAMGLEALEPQRGDRVAHAAGSSGYLAALMSRLVGEEGEVIVLPRGGWLERRRQAAALRASSNVSVVSDVSRGTSFGLHGTHDGIWLDGAVPRLPDLVGAHLHESGGRAVAFVGPRFRRQDMVGVVRDGESFSERRIAAVQVPILTGPHGWIAA